MSKFEKMNNSLNDNQEIKTFEKCLGLAADAKNTKKHLLLGNGFSIDLFPEIFNYKALKDRVTSEKTKRIFSEMETNDFEYVMRKLTDAIKICGIYPDEGKILNERLTKDLNSLKKTLIEVITNSHPPNPQAITADQYGCCYDFLKHFDKKYSLNYDLLLYWVHMHFLGGLKDEKSLKCDDGFRYPENDQFIVTWEIGRERTQNLYYIHGAMHIFSHGSTVEKYTWTNSGKTISEQVRESIEKQKYPVFISEGTKEHKLSRMRDNSYLGRSFSSLKSIKGNLFIFGHSLRDEDDHVFDCINANEGIKSVFISIFGDVNSDDNKKIFSKVETWKNTSDSQKKKKNYYYYDSRSANVWRK